MFDESGQMAGCQIVDAAVQAERPSAGEQRLYGVTVKQAAELGANVGLHQGIERRGRVGVRVSERQSSDITLQGIAQRADAAGQRRGLVGQRHLRQRERRLHAAAAVVAAEHHPFDLEIVEGILQYAHKVVVGGGNHVSDIAVDEEFAGMAAGEHFGGNAAIGAANPQRMWPLPGYQFFKIFRVMLALLQRPAAVTRQ